MKNTVATTKTTPQIPVSLCFNIKPRTFKIWSAFYDYIWHNDYADVADNNFIPTMEMRFKLSKPSISRHLRRMAEAGILDAYPMTRVKGQKNPFSIISVPPPPSCFIRYVLYGKKPSKDSSRI